jgi:hypothetical protein
VHFNGGHLRGGGILESVINVKRQISNRSRQSYIDLVVLTSAKTHMELCLPVVWILQESDATLVVLVHACCTRTVLASLILTL